jgi:hypothetical protein
VRELIAGGLRDSLVFGEVEHFVSVDGETLFEFVDVLKPHINHLIPVDHLLLFNATHTARRN